MRRWEAHIGSLISNIAALVSLRDDDRDIDYMITANNTAMTDTVSEILGGWDVAGKNPGPPEISVLDLSNERRDL